MRYEHVVGIPRARGPDNLDCISGLQYAFSAAARAVVDARNGEMLDDLQLHRALNKVDAKSVAHATRVNSVDPRTPSSSGL
jgi:hypothetical protein